MRWPSPSARRTAMTRAGRTIDPEVSRRLRAVLDIPLVLHGSSGVPDDQTATVSAPA